MCLIRWHPPKYVYPCLMRMMIIFRGKRKKFIDLTIKKFPIHPHLTHIVQHPLWCVTQTSLGSIPTWHWQEGAGNMSCTSLSISCSSYPAIWSSLAMLSGCDLDRVGWREHREKGFTGMQVHDCPLRILYNFGPSGVRALPLAVGINEGGHYFRYCHNPTNKTKTRNLVGVVLLLVKNPPPHHTGCDYILSHFQATQKADFWYAA